MSIKFNTFDSMERAFFIYKKENALLQKKLKKVKTEKEEISIKDNIRNLKFEYINYEFNHKLKNPEHELSAVAKKVYDFAFKRTTFNPLDNKSKDTLILKNGKDYSFIMSEPHFIYRHIKVLKKRYKFDARLYFNGSEKLCISTGVEKKLDYLISDLRKKSQKDLSLVFDLDMFKMGEKRWGEAQDELTPNFKIEGDGKYHFEILVGRSLANCPGYRGNHSGIRLYDKDGYVYSMGVHPKKPLTVTESFVPSTLIYDHTDLYEWLEYRKLDTYKFELNKNEFEELKKSIEDEMKASKNGTSNKNYFPIGENCSDFTLNMISKYLPSMDIKKMQIDSFATLIPKQYDKFFRHTPSWIKWPVKGITQVFKLLAVIFIFKGYSTNREIRGTKSFLSRYRFKLWNPNIFKTTHPFYVNLYFKRFYEQLTMERKNIIAKKDET